MDEILVGAERFTDTAEQDRYDKCEGCIMRVLNEIRGLGRQWKVSPSDTTACNGI